MTKSTSTMSKQSTRLKLKMESSKQRGSHFTRYRRDKKLSDMLGYQSEELLQIYKAHFRYGKVWKEDRSTRSVPPLCKHQMFCETPIKSQSRQLGWMLPYLLRYNKAKATRGGLSSLHNRFAGDIQPHAVGKRTPRFPVKYSDAEECGCRATPKADQDSGESYGDQAAALPREKASVRDGSLPASSFLSKMVEGIESLPIQRDGIKATTGAPVNTYIFSTGRKNAELRELGLKTELCPLAILQEGIFNPKKRKVNSLVEANHLPQRNIEVCGIEHASVEIEKKDVNEGVSFCSTLLRKRRQRISKDERIAAEALCALAYLPERCMHVKNEIGISVAVEKSNTPGFEFAKSTSCKISDSSPLQKTERKALLPCCRSIPEQKNYDFQPSGKTWKMKRSTAAKEVKPSADAGYEPQFPEKTLFITYRRRAKVKNMLFHCLSSPLLRRWCAFEWFYNGIDSHWFLKNEFVEYLNHTKLGDLPTRLTRPEWSIIRSALGKPRRLSELFFKEERKKLYHYRENVRNSLSGVHKKFEDGLLPTLGYPFSVGQKVIAWYPLTREFHNGNILSIGHNICTVQFDQPDARVEVIMDISCMLLEPVNIIPSPIKSPYYVTSSLYSSLHGSKLEFNCDNSKVEDHMTSNFSSDLQKSDFGSPDMASNVMRFLNGLLQEAKTMVTEEAGELAVVNNCHPHLDCFSSLGTGWSALFLDRGTQPILDTAKATSTNCKMDLTDSKHMMYQSASTHLPIELLSACLATLMMIQKCSERKYPPEEVAQMLHFALKSLYPSCPQNLPLYQQVELFMGIIKSQVLALVPTHSK